jgi:hypothetical protein
LTRLCLTGRLKRKHNKRAPNENQITASFIAGIVSAYMPIGGLLQHAKQAKMAQRNRHAED